MFVSSLHDNGSDFVIELDEVGDIDHFIDSVLDILFYNLQRLGGRSDRFLLKHLLGSVIREDQCNNRRYDET